MVLHFHSSKRDRRDANSCSISQEVISERKKEKERKRKRERKRERERERAKESNDVEMGIKEEEVIFLRMLSEGK